MATQNLFEQYGIKEVADVTFYRIDKKEETFESQREISAASILKGGIELRTVYPLDGGLGAEDGFEAYVFTNATILTGANYDCDDTNTIIANLRTEYKASQSKTDEQISAAVTSEALALVKSAKGDPASGLSADFTKPTVLSYIDAGSGIELPSSKVANFDTVTLTQGAGVESNVVGTKVSKTTVTRTVTVAQATDDLTVTAGANCTILVTSDNTDVATVTETTEGSVYTISAATATAAGTARITVEITNDQVGVDPAPASNKSFTVTADGAGKVVTSASTITAKIQVPTTYTYTVTTSIMFDGTNSTDAATGIFNTNSTDPDADYEDGIGTHEFSYPQQICMLFAKKQNLISKTGVRYQFNGIDGLFGDIEFNDEFAGAPRSEEKIVVVGLAGKFTEGTYDVEEVNQYIKNLTTTYSAKAYDVIYSDYAELVVEDEMGYYNQDFLGYAYNRDGNTAAVDFFTSDYTYMDWIEDIGGIADAAVANAVMWEDGVHYSINDAIAALRQKQLTIDVSENGGRSGIKSIFGGYKVSSKLTDADATPDAGTEDIHADGYTENTYSYGYQGQTGEAPTSEYPLADVNAAINEIALSAEAFGKSIRVDAGLASNRAIWLAVNGASDSAAGAYIYLLHNKNARRLASDTDGIFVFEDKKGNTLYYQDKIFKGIEWLALVVLGNKGLIFVVNRHGNSDVKRVAWMVNESGYVNDRTAAALVKNGLIHTTDITVKDETFEATCTVKSMKVRKITKKTNHYTPVLFLDTLKVSTIEQSAEEVYAQGGKGNAKLVGWDYGKEITLTLQDALFTPASMSAIFGSYDGNDFTNGIKEVKSLDRFEKCTAKRSFIVPAGNSNGTPSEADKTAQAVYFDPNTMKPYADGTPIAEGEVFYKFTRSIAYDGQSLGHMIEISADKFPGTYKIVGDTFVRAREGGADQRFQFVIPQAKMQSSQTITLEAEGDPTVFDMNMTVLRPDDGVMVRFIQYDVVENEEENDGSTMVKDTENLNLLDDAELFKVSAEGTDDESAIGATEY